MCSDLAQFHIYCVYLCKVCKDVQGVLTHIHSKVHVFLSRDSCVSFCTVRHMEIDPVLFIVLSAGAHA